MLAEGRQVLAVKDGVGAGVHKEFNGGGGGVTQKGAVVSSEQDETVVAWSIFEGKRRGDDFNIEVNARKACVTEGS